MKVLVAPGAFKGSLPAAEVARHLGSGLARHPRLAVTLLPLADGGDGSVRAAVAAGYRSVPVRTVGPTGLPVDAEVAFDGHTAVVEVANTCGIGLLPSSTTEPMASSSRGFGLAVKAALELRPQRVVLALGGSASTDGGLGLLAALGAVFTRGDGSRLEGSGEDLGALAAADLAPLRSLPSVEWVVASDVDSPLTGPAGAARTFGPQKGATPEQVERLEAGLVRLAHLTGDGRVRLHDTPGAGAAGGLGHAGLLLGARVVSGAAFFLDLLGFDGNVADAGLVITGEGCLDEQTGHGKLPWVVSARSAPRPVVAVVGRAELAPDSPVRRRFRAVHELVQLTSIDTRDDPQLSARLLTVIGDGIGRWATSPPGG